MRLASIAALICAALLAFAGTASAQIFNVTTTDDDVGTCDPGDCSLREAVAAANTNLGPDTIMVPAGHYVLSQGELLITEDFTMIGASARSTIIDAAGSSRVLNIDEGVDSISHVTITGGHADQGAGIFFNDDTLTLDHVAVVGNTAVGDTSFGGQGGGIFANEPVTMTNSVVSGNVADGTGSTFSGGQGGGIFGNEPVVLTNVTLSDNKAIPAPSGATFPHSQGGGIFVNEQDTVLTNVTVAGNQASGADAGAGIFVNDDLTIQNSIFAHNTTDGVENNCTNEEDQISGDHNLESGTDCSFTAAGDKQGADPVLGAVANNGGDTDTQALGAGSPAIDAAAAASCPATDQRDVPRPQLGGCDMGAFEVTTAAAAPPPPAPGAAKDTVKPTVTVAGVRAACVSRSISIRVHASDASGVKTTRITLDGKRVHVKSKTRFTLKINVRKLTAGRHVLRITTTDGAGNTTRLRRTITRCAKRAAKPRRQAEPRFTG